jgi:hypothetical protein
MLRNILDTNGESKIRRFHLTSNSICVRMLLLKLMKDVVMSRLDVEGVVVVVLLVAVGVGLILLGLR